MGVQRAGDLANVRRRHRRRDTCSEVERGERAFMLAQLGELSSVRQALAGAELAPGPRDSRGSETTTARTVARQVGSNVEKATAPCHHALPTRAGCECVSHVVQALCQANPNTTGVSVCDTISRAALMQGLLDMEGGETVLPFVRQFHGRVSPFLCEDDAGVSRATH